MKVKRNKCKCGEVAYWRDGKKSLCFKCLECQTDLARGYSFDRQGFKIISLEEIYKEANNGV